MKDQQRLSRFAEGKGFVAALDQSGGSTPKTLGLYGIDGNRYSSEAEMMALIHGMRSRVMKAPGFTSENILGAILFAKTMNDTVDGIPAPEFLWDRRGILPFLKIDVGLQERNAGISLMRPVPEMDEQLEHAGGLGVFGTKMRSVIHEPARQGVLAVVDQQFEFAERIIDRGLLPIVEPEVSIDCEAKADCEAMLFDAISNRLRALADGRMIALKLTLPEDPGRYAEFIAHDQVVRVTALSGGYDRSEACRRLAANPGMIASFSRALLEGLSESMDDREFDRKLGDSISEIFAASCT